MLALTLSLNTKKDIIYKDLPDTHTALRSIPKTDKTKN